MNATRTLPQQSKLSGTAYKNGLFHIVVSIILKQQEHQVQANARGIGKGEVQEYQLISGYKGALFCILLLDSKEKGPIKTGEEQAAVDHSLLKLFPIVIIYSPSHQIMLYRF